MKVDPINTKVLSLGKASIPSPLENREGNGRFPFVNDSESVLIDIHPQELETYMQRGETPPTFELAGPRKNIYFDPSKLRCALVTCGGLCPGLNDIIRSIVLELYHLYGVRNIHGIRYGLEGFIPKYGHDVIDLKPATVTNILDMGGSILGSSRGPQNIDDIVD